VPADVTHAVTRPKSRRLRILWFVAAVLVPIGGPGCGGDAGPATPTQPAQGISPQARTYLDQLVDVMQANSIKRLTIDWGGFRTRVLAEAGAAQTIADTYPAVRVALQLLNDGHSSFQPPGGALIFERNRTCALPAVVTRPALPATIGYVKVDSFTGSAAESAALAARLQGEIAAADRDDLAGWIVDLRGNGGGNMWPMIAGVGPILGEGVAGYFIDPVGTEAPWEYRDGASWSGTAVQERVAAPYRLRRERPRVAVVVDNAVASSGEATFVSFRARPNTRSFGVPTCGLSTANRAFLLSDGARLNLTAAVMADRSKTRYGDSIAPDEIVSDASEAVARAVAWLVGST
jgi:carboxyl-terminal processing protease